MQWGVAASLPRRDNACAIRYAGSGEDSAVQESGGGLQDRRRLERLKPAPFSRNQVRTEAISVDETRRGMPIPTGTQPVLLGSGAPVVSARNIRDCPRRAGCQALQTGQMRAAEKQFR